MTRAARRSGRSARGSGSRVLAALVGPLLVVLAGCSGSGPFASDPTPSPSASADPATPTPSDPGTPSASPDPSASPGTASPGTASPDPSGSASPSSSAVQVSCASVTVSRVGRVQVSPPRTTEVATLVSDGRALTPGSRQQADFGPPLLTAPGGGTISDPGTLAAVARLVDATRHRVLLDRPPGPDETADPARRPFSSPGTYAVYNASSPLTAEAVVQCAGQEQTWTFTAEADPVTGSVNCAVEPARSNALARVVFAQSC